MGIDQSALDALQTEAGLVRSHTVTSDSESTTMRSATELKELDDFLSNKAAGCGDGRLNPVLNVFGFSVETKRYRG